MYKNVHSNKIKIIINKHINRKKIKERKYSYLFVLFSLEFLLDWIQEK